MLGQIFIQFGEVDGEGKKVGFEDLSSEDLALILEQVERIRREREFRNAFEYAMSAMIPWRLFCLVFYFVVAVSFRNFDFGVLQLHLNEFIAIVLVAMLGWRMARNFRGAIGFLVVLLSVSCSAFVFVLFHESRWLTGWRYVVWLIMGLEVLFWARFLVRIRVGMSVGFR
jgi:hypothetical protein